MPMSQDVPEHENIKRSRRDLCGGKLIPKIVAQTQLGSDCGDELMTPKVVDLKCNSEQQREVALLFRALTACDCNDMRLVDVEKHPQCLSKCNMIWNLRTSRWIPDFYVYDISFAHSDKVDKACLCHSDVAMATLVLMKSISKFSIPGKGGCNGILEGLNCK